MAEDETADQFAGKITGMVSKATGLGHVFEQDVLVKKLLDAVPDKYFNLVASIEKTVDLDSMRFEDAVGRLKAFEERLRGRERASNSQGQLLFNRTESNYKGKSYDQSGSRGKGWLSSQGRGKGREIGGQYRDDEDQDGCENRDGQHHGSRYTGQRRTNDRQWRKKDRSHVQCYRCEDFGNKSYFYELNEQVTGTVKFGDESCIDIRGKGSVLIEGKTGEQRLLTDVYYIPSLQCNIISLGQATEGGCEIHMKHDLLTIKDDIGKLLVKVTRTKNRLYKINLKITSPGKRAIIGMKNFAGSDLQSIGLKEDKPVTRQIPIKDPSFKIQSPKKSVQETKRVVKKVILAHGKACDDQTKQIAFLEGQ
ncbi:uncharacterized protein LOC143607750 [Bidens hawaiensis]|uniref:uncharacterized protein LOC143607750 n=1 Tax=Bidens hawaiensis TaxID=980011 RepID=UPI004048FD2A